MGLVGDIHGIEFFSRFVSRINELEQMEKLAISISLTIVVQLFDYLTRYDTKKEENLLLHTKVTKFQVNSLLELLKNNSQEGKVSVKYAVRLRRMGLTLTPGWR